MKKFKLLSVLTLACTIICGCSCGRINEETYEDAVSTYKNTDAIHFSRLEIIKVSEEDIFTRKRVDAKYTFDSSRDVYTMEYSLVYSEGSNSGTSDIRETQKYYYSKEKMTLYTYSKIGESQLDRYKETNVSYDSKFNINTCDDSDCMMMITGNFAPVFNLNAVSDFSIEGKRKTATVQFKAVCPSYENCASNSQIIDYTLTINDRGNIETLSYDVVNENTTHSIKYTFYGYGSNNVKVVFPNDLESYIEK